MVSCDKLLQELSNFIDNDIDPALRAEIERHLRSCRRCAVLADSVKKIVSIIADEKVFEISSGYSERLHQFIDAHLK